MDNIFPIKISASLARRLAEAADGFRNVDKVYFVAGYKKPHPIKDFPDAVSAKAYCVQHSFSDNEYGIFGPYYTIDDLENFNITGPENIEKIDLIVHFKNNYQQLITLSGGIDSIFLNLSSFEKFVFPYYCHLFGVEYAKILRDNLIAQYQGYQKGDNVIMAIASAYPHLNYTIMDKLNDGEQLP